MEPIDYNLYVDETATYMCNLYVDETDEGIIVVAKNYYGKSISKILFIRIPLISLQISWTKK